jgi:hypothetical protein
MFLKNFFALISSIWAPDSMAASFSHMSQNFRANQMLKLIPVVSHKADFKKICETEWFSTHFHKGIG